MLPIPTVLGCGCAHDGSKWTTFCEDHAELQRELAEARAHFQKMADASTLLEEANERLRKERDRLREDAKTLRRDTLEEARKTIREKCEPCGGTGATGRDEECAYCGMALAVLVALAGGEGE